MGELMWAPKKLTGLDSRVLQVATDSLGSPYAQGTLRITTRHWAAIESDHA